VLPALDTLAFGQSAAAMLPTASASSSDSVGSLAAAAAQAATVAGALGAALQTPLSLSSVVSDAGTPCYLPPACGSCVPDGLLRVVAQC